MKTKKGKENPIENSKIKHAIFEVVAMHALSPQVLGRAHDLVLRRGPARRRAIIHRLEQLVDVAPPALARQICIVGGAHKTNRLRGAREEVAHVVRHLLELVRGEFVLVVHAEVMSGPSSTLEAAVRLEEEVEGVDACNTLVDDGAWLRVAQVGISRRFLDGIEARIVTLSADDDSERRSVRSTRCVELFECLLYLGHLLPENCCVLAL